MYVVIIECGVPVYKVAMVSTRMKVPMTVETLGAVRNVPMAVEAMETDKAWMNVPMAVGTFGAVRIVPNETGVKVPMAMEANKATVIVLMPVQTVVRNVTMTLMIVSMVAVEAIISAMSCICECLVVACNNWT